MDEEHTIDYYYDLSSGKLAMAIMDNGDVEQIDLAYVWNGHLQTDIGLTLPYVTCGTIEIEQSWDSAFRISDMDINGYANVDISYEYDNDGLRTTFGKKTGSVFENPFMNLSRDPNTGNVVSSIISENAGDVASAHSYSDFKELEYESYTFGSGTYIISYERDLLGRIVEKTQQLDEDGDSNLEIDETLFYQYDVAGRLEQVCGNVSCTPAISEYDYDVNGNRVQHIDYLAGVTDIGAYNANIDQLLTYGNDTDGHTSYSYTLNGELESKTLGSDVTTYDYDSLGNLRGVILPSGNEIKYLIDGENRRVGKLTRPYGVPSWTFERGWVYKDGLNPISELDSTGAVVKRFVYGSKPNVPDYMLYNDLGYWIPYRIVSNHLGSPVLVIDIENSIVVQRIDYNEFGISCIRSGLKTLS